MDPVWTQLPLDFAEKICNMLPKVRRMNPILKDEIESQWYKFDKYYYNCVQLFGLSNAEYVMYDDMKNVCQIVDDYPEDMPFMTVIENMWKKMTHEQRNSLVYLIDFDHNTDLRNFV